jgi:Reverse transcriptase (RNA-dependent DNA polymerase)
MNTVALYGWKTHQLDFVLAFPQAPVETDICYMEIPAGFGLKGKGKRECVLKLVNNLYGQKQAGRVWNIFLTNGLKKIGFTQSRNDPCIYWRKSTIIVIYTDDTIVTGPVAEDTEKAVCDIAAQFEITLQPMVNDFLGVHIERNEDTKEVTLYNPF